MLVVELCVLVAPSFCNSYHRLNQQLKKLNKSKNPVDLKDYIEAARKELSSSRIKDEDYRKAVESFIALEEILDPKCNRNDRDKLRRLANNTSGRKFHKNPDKLAPVQKVVYTIGLRRAEKCMPIWMEKIKAAYEGLPVGVKQRAEFMVNYFDRVARTKKLSYRAHMEMLFAYHFEYSDIFGNPTFNLRRELYTHVEGLAASEPQKCYFASMIQKYLTNPCKLYSEAIGTFVYEARYDAGMYENGVGPIGNTVEEQEKMLDFYKAMLSDRMCANSKASNFVSKLSTAWWTFQSDYSTKCYKTIMASHMHQGIDHRDTVDLNAPSPVEGIETG